MKNFARTILASSLLLSSAVFATTNPNPYANDMYIDLGTNQYDLDRDITPDVDADSKTSIFDEFGFTQLLATSVYDLTDTIDGNPLTGDFYDTNIGTELSSLGIPTSGPSMGDPTITVDLTLPTYSQVLIESLNPLVPPLRTTDSEGYLDSWELVVEYHFDGSLTPTGPVYTGGTFDVFFIDYSTLGSNGAFPGVNKGRVLGGTLTDSEITLGNLNLFFDITFAKDNFLWIDDGSGNFVDAHDGTVSGNYATMVLDTNVNPVFPEADQLLVIGTDAVRQTTLDGTVTALIPEPGSLALLGLGLLGFGVTRSKKA